MLEFFINFDRKLFLFINSRHNSFWDSLMFWVSDKEFWIPFYILILCLLFNKYKTKTLIILIFIAISITLSDQLSSSIIRPLVGRLRPSHEPSLALIVHLNKAGAGGLYGFVSSHAANSFALATFLCLILSKSWRPLKIIMFFWASLICYSRIYNGVHYPGDVFGGAILGLFIGWIVSRIYIRVYLNKNNPLTAK